jgi:hypothetical protein
VRQVSLCPGASFAEQAIMRTIVPVAIALAAARKREPNNQSYCSFQH